jgi:hypothetical protein
LTINFRLSHFHFSFAFLHSKSRNTIFQIQEYNIPNPGIQNKNGEIQYSKNQKYKSATQEYKIKMGKYNIPNPGIQNKKEMEIQKRFS